MRQTRIGAESPARAGDARVERGAGRTAGKPGPIAALAAAAMLAACAATTYAGRPSIQEVESRMPRDIADFMRGDSAIRPGPVLTLDYATANRAAVATVQVYDVAGLAAPSDPAAPEIERELDAAVAMVTEVPAGRTGRRLTERGRMTVVDARLRCARMEGSFGRAPVERTLCVGGAEGRFVKIQVTMAVRSPAPADAIAFATGAAHAVREG